MLCSLPETVTGITVDHQCGSSQQTCHVAAQAVMSGTQETVYVKTGGWDDARTEDALFEKSVSSVAETVLKHETVYEAVVDRKCCTRTKRAPDRGNLLTS